jgi:hypothetical protein
LVVVAFIPRAAAPQGDPLGPEFRVNTFTTSRQFDPAVASDASGNFVVVWWSTETPGALAFVFGQRYASTGAPLGPEFRVNTAFGAYAQLRPAVASDAAGNFVVVWGTADAVSSIVGQRYASTGAPLGYPFVVDGPSPKNKGNPAVTSDAVGNFVVMWAVDTDYFDEGWNVVGRRYANSGEPLGTVFPSTQTFSDEIEPAAASDGSGNFVVVWTALSEDGSGHGIFGRRYTNSGEPLGFQFRVNTYTTQGQRDPAVASAAAHNFVVVWSSSTQDGSSYGVFGQRYAGTGAPLGPEFRVNTYTTGLQNAPAVASDSSGNFVVVWSNGSQDPSGGISGQRYADTGEPVGQEFRVNTFTTNFQGQPAVASDAAGNFVVVWESLNQDGSSYGVFGQRYSQIVPVELMHFWVE